MRSFWSKRIGKVSHLPGQPLWRCAFGLVIVLLWPANDALAVRLNGSLSWDFTRTQTRSGFSNVTQNGFGQGYRLGLTGAVLNRRIATWTLGGGWRRDLTSFAGVSTHARDVRLRDLDAGLVLLPTTMPMTINFRRSVVDNKGGELVGQSTLNSTISFSTRVRMPDGEALGISANQTTQESDSGDTRSRLLSLSKRFNLSKRNILTSSYRFSQYKSPTSTETGHGVSVSNLSTWSEQLTSNVFANLSSRDSTSTRLAGGRSLFTNNSYGASMNYRRSTVMNANLAYSYSETPQDQNDDIISQLLSGRANYRFSKKTDLNGNLTWRRLDLSDITLTTSTVSVGIRHRPKFGWTAGGRVGLSSNGTNGTTGVSSSDRNSYNLSGFLSGRHDLVPVEVRWGTDVGYVTTKGDLPQDRLTSTARISAIDKQVPRVRIVGEYRITDIREAQGGGSLDPFTLEHGATITTTLDTLKGIWLPNDVLRGNMRMGTRWNRQSDSGRTFRGSDFGLDARYTLWSGLDASAGYDFSDNSSTLVSSTQVVRTDVTWTKRLFRRGTGKLTGGLRRTYLGGGFESSEASITYAFNYSIGLVRVSLTADAKTIDLAGVREGTDTTSIRLNIVRTF